VTYARSRTILISLSLAIAALVITPSNLQAQNQLGGHFGAVVPLVTWADGETTTVGDNFTIGFPMGLTLKKTDKVAFDLELVPSIQNEPLSVSLTVHPGVIFSLPQSFAAGVRVAFDVNAASWGFTPLLAKAFPVNDGAYAFFVEFDLPIRFQEDEFGESRTAVTMAAHVGIGF
jgi:hypothetical protein